MSKDHLSFMLLFSIGLLWIPAIAIDFQLFYRMKDFQRKMSMECDASDTVGDLRRRLLAVIAPNNEYTKLNNRHLSISYGGKELMDDEQTLADASICAQATVDLEWVLADGYYQFLVSHTSKLLTVDNLSVVQSGFGDVNSQRFFVQRQVGGCYKIQSVHNHLYWRLYTENRPLPSVILHCDEANDNQLFEFKDRGEDKWIIGGKGRQNALTVNGFDDGRPIAEYDDNLQLFYCDRIDGLATHRPISKTKVAIRVGFVTWILALAFFIWKMNLVHAVISDTGNLTF